MGIISEFKEFALKGSMFDTAVGIIIGGAMGTVIGSLVKDVIMPIVGAVGGQPDFSAIKLGPILFGNFLNALIAFLVLAWVVFMLVKAVNAAKAMASKPAAPAAPPPPPRSEVLLEEIRNALVKK